MSNKYKDVFNYSAGATFFKFEKVGDTISGTFIGKRKIMNRLNNSMQWVYDIRTEDGELYTIGGKPGVDRQMRYVRLGQIIGFTFVREGEQSQPGMNPPKIIQVHAHPDLVNEKWLQEQEANNTPSTDANDKEAAVNDENSGDNIDEAMDQFGDDSTNDKKEEPDMTPEEIAAEMNKPNEGNTNQKKTKKTDESNGEETDKIMKIYKLAEEKWNEKNPTVIKKKITEKTELAFVPANLDEIIKKLEAM